MYKLLSIIAVALSTIAVAQTCLIRAPLVPPIPVSLLVMLPSDGGTSGCTIKAQTTNGTAAATYNISNAKCAQAVQMAKQAAANDNGWNDGGAP